MTDSTIVGEVRRVVAEGTKEIVAVVREDTAALSRKVDKLAARVEQLELARERREAASQALRPLREWGTKVALGVILVLLLAGAVAVVRAWSISSAVIPDLEKVTSP